MKLNQILITAILTLSLGWFLYSKMLNESISSKEEQLQEIQKLSLVYEKYKNRWSQNATLQNLEELIKNIQSFGFSITTDKNKNITKINFELKEDNINILTSKIINANLEFRKIKISKKDDYTLSIELEVIN